MEEPDNGSQSDTEDAQDGADEDDLGVDVKPVTLRCMLQDANAALIPELNALLPPPMVRGIFSCCVDCWSTLPASWSQPLPSLPPYMCMVAEDAGRAALEAMLKLHTARMPAAQVQCVEACCLTT